MLNKIFLALFVPAFLVMGVLTFLCYSQLQSIGFAPERIVQNFSEYDSLYQTILWISSIALLVLANVILWTSRKAWALWLTFAYFAVFILLNMWWLGESLVAYKKQNNLWEGGFSIGGLVAAVFVVAVGIGLFFNQFLVFRMHDKMFGKPQEKVEIPTEEKSEEFPAEKSGESPVKEKSEEVPAEKNEETPVEEISAEENAGTDSNESNSN